MRKVVLPVIITILFWASSCLDQDICTPSSVPMLNIELLNIEQPEEIFTDTLYYNQYLGKTENGEDTFVYPSYKKVYGKNLPLSFHQTDTKEIKMVIYRRSDYLVYARDADGNRLQDKEGKDSILGMNRTTRDTLIFRYDIGQAFENSSCGAKVIFDNVEYQGSTSNYWMKELQPTTTNITDDTTINLQIKTSVFKRQSDYHCAECPKP
ncbi:MULTISPECIES: DUF6452 family protein [Weeksella]|uniref:Lipoprotein n=1 Tax=Weeksella virosa (strain ATCC 43766 / DSM 16922 / JCM 21250 / CCUG 30538 / CDC 9751 / IAM 14551 / NBRC 16016 / NCTC 11634 / CL345/78) TaxID=865938 RepID=F0NYG2_WEEVC|nr:MULTISPECIES: DUF6452 family protein [Weeksella]ADX67082.1 hypothetical protein Weevi_0362 [Weeksella virosa DSM 16922]MDK7375678.1 DUF6452 family protein [Weeksella virosa]MDK7675009.1 DUF6452 family protein [Weeksella virosa]SUP53352.1 Uncharacterised protein [Weeksella virosa]VEH63183.1 Uncharacterised protein [Weeksella virosa]